MLGLGFVVAGVLASRRLKEIGRPADWAYEMVFAALVGGIVGARLWSVLENWDEASDDIFGALFRGSGLVFYGGLLGGAHRRARLGAVARGARPQDVRHRGAGARGGVRDRADRLPARRRRRLRQADWDGPWAMAYPDGTVPTTDRGASDAGLRDARDGRSSPGSCGAGATACAPAGCSRSTSCSPARSGFSSSSCAATTASSWGSRWPS